MRHERENEHDYGEYGGQDGPLVEPEDAQVDPHVQHLCPRVGPDEGEAARREPLLVVFILINFFGSNNLQESLRLAGKKNLLNDHPPGARPCLWRHPS